MTTAQSIEDAQAVHLANTREKLIEAIRAAKRGPAHESCIYTFGPYAAWLNVISDSRSARGFHLVEAAKQLTYQLHHHDHRKELRELALWIVGMALENDDE